MSQTKQKILDHALALFNTNGVDGVTLRGIARAAGISQGNLTYHYSVKEEMVRALYYQLIEKINRQMEPLLQPATSLRYMYDSTLVTMRCFYGYRFLMRDLYKILRQDPELKSHYNQLQILRRQQFTALFKVLMELGTIRSPHFPEEYERLYERMTILGDHWTHAEGILHQSQKDYVGYHHQLLFEVIFPYLTEKGRQEYLNTVR